MREKNGHYDRQKRNSAIELLKIMAIILIVIAHVVQTLSADNPYITYDDYFINLYVATGDVKRFILILFWPLGVLGNDIFFVCSSWFLLNSLKCNKRKWFYMLSEVWFVSVTILIIVEIVSGGAIQRSLVLKSILPTTFSNNWYVTCYLLFYPIHPFLNSLIHNMDKKALFRSSVFMFCLFFILNWLCYIEVLFFRSALIEWIAIYFVMAYLQLYGREFTESFKRNVILLVVGIVGHFGAAIIVNVLGLCIESFSGSVKIYGNSWNPFFVAIAVALFNLMKKVDFRSKWINYISSLSLLVYIIHENHILGIYYRPAMWQFVYTHFGYEHLLFWTLALVAIVLAFALIASVVYDITLQKVVHRVVDRVYLFLRKNYLRVEERFLKM